MMRPNRSRIKEGLIPCSALDPDLLLQHIFPVHSPDGSQGKLFGLLNKSVSIFKSTPTSLENSLYFRSTPSRLASRPVPVSAFAVSARIQNSCGYIPPKLFDVPSQARLSRSLHSFPPGKALAVSRDKHHAWRGNVPKGNDPMIIGDAATKITRQIERIGTPARWQKLSPFTFGRSASLLLINLYIAQAVFGFAIGLALPFVQLLR